MMEIILKWMGMCLSIVGNKFIPFYEVKEGQTMTLKERIISMLILHLKELHIHNL